ncbi:MAG: hypothetical protein IT169_19715 [Bryobacterales bacterium]|nr:hypothetical protein [Bryobacterales bacterium]
MIRLSVLLVLAIRLIGPMVLCAGADALTISWDDLKSTVGARPVVIVVDRSTEVYGTVVGQDDSGIVIAVTKSKPGDVYPHGRESRLDRSAITRMAVVTDPLRTRWRWAGVAGGYVAGAGLGVLAGGGEQDPRLFIGMLGGAILGYHWGKALDKQTTEIRFLETAPARGAAKPRAALLPPYLANGANTGREEAGWD